LIEKCSLPDDALLQAYAHTGAYTDCYCTRLPSPVPFADYVTAFYTTWLFRLERIVLRIAVSRPSSDAEARQLADGKMETFAAWTVEVRTGNQLLMCDFRGRTRSWFMVSGTRLLFGSAVVPVTVTESKFRVLLGLHRLYSRALLRAARSRLQSAAFSRG
jgi:hypothetical protein